MYSVPVKPTLYDGHHFRSRNEARFAAFLNELNIVYKYEPRLYEFPLSATSPLHPTHPSGTLKYLPDFEALGMFFELKPKEPMLIEKIKASCLSEQTGVPVYVVWPPAYQTMLFHEGEVELGWTFRMCTVCGTIGLKENCKCGLRTAKHPTLVAALKKTKSMRFT